MKNFFERYWTPTAGAISSLSFKGVNDLAQTPEAAEIAEQAVRHEPTLMSYFIIGIVGALGGLFVKVAWGIFKKIFPKLHGIDK